MDAVFILSQCNSAELRDKDKADDWGQWSALPRVFRLLLLATIIHHITRRQQKHDNTACTCSTNINCPKGAVSQCNKIPSLSSVDRGRVCARLFSSPRQASKDPLFEWILLWSIILATQNKTIDVDVVPNSITSPPTATPCTTVLDMNRLPSLLGAARFASLGTTRTYLSHRLLQPQSYCQQRLLSGGDSKPGDSSEVDSSKFTHESKQR